MSRARHRRLVELFRAACELDGAERETFLARECDDDALHTEVLALLAHDSNPHPGLAEDHAVRGELVRGALLSAHDAGETRLPARIGPYELLEKLGEGGMGEVFAADQSEPVRRRVALKLIKLGMDSAQVVARFEAERQALARMSHPNVAQVFDGGTTEEGRPYFVMEYVPGELITEHCDRHTLSTRARVELFLGVCEGVQHAHQKGLVHRDLKPSNLLVTRHEERASPKIIDFGVARALTGRLADQTLQTQVGQVVGTLDYMSPEQSDPNAPDVDTRSDIYSLGVVLYELVSGLLPFDFRATDDASIGTAQHLLRNTDPPTPSTRLRRQSAAATAIAPRHGTDERSLLQQIHGDLDWICLKALEKDPDRRYASASELADDLRRHLAHEPVLARRPGALYRARKFVRRNRVAVSAGAIVAAVLLTAAVGVISTRLEFASLGREHLRLSGKVGLERLVRQADSNALWPAHPANIPAMEAWLVSAQELHDHLDDHRNRLDELRAHATHAGGDESSPAWRFDNDAEQLLHDELTALVAGLEQLGADLLADDANSPEHGWSVPRRLALAQQLSADFSAGSSHAAVWEAARSGIRETYPGLELKPQMGLRPLGPDPVSHLWEFAHVMSGAPAQRDAEGQLIVTGETGLVFVLLPGGEYWMGAQTSDEHAANYIAAAQLQTASPEKLPYDYLASEGPVHRVTVEPFFMSKFEMTQGQWQRFVGANPSTPVRDPELELAPDRPVNSVSWRACSVVTARLGLALPSEEQWEYAARGGTTSAWWTGDDWQDVRDVGRANLRDGGTIDDGEPGLASITFEAPNPFGLVAVLGNVTEWTSSRVHSYGQEPDLDPSPYQSRGGSFFSGPQWARSAYRNLRGLEDFTFPALGLRPARAVER